MHVSAWHEPVDLETRGRWAGLSHSSLMTNNILRRKFGPSQTHGPERHAACKGNRRLAPEAALFALVPWHHNSRGVALGYSTDTGCGVLSKGGRGVAGRASHFNSCLNQTGALVLTCLGWLGDQQCTIYSRLSSPTAGCFFFTHSSHFTLVCMLRLPSRIEEPPAKRMRFESIFIGGDEVECPYIRDNSHLSVDSVEQNQHVDMYWDPDGKDVWIYYEGLGWYSNQSGWWRWWRENEKACHDDEAWKWNDWQEAACEDEDWNFREEHKNWEEPEKVDDSMEV